MAFGEEFIDCMPHSIVVNSFASLNGYGKPTYSTQGSTYRGLVQNKRRVIRGTDGTEKVSSARVILASTVAISITDKITLPDGTVRPVLNVDLMFDEEGQSHVQISFG